MILKLESGGIPWVEYRPLKINTAPSGSSTSSGSKSSKDKEDLNDKELLSLLKDIKALPSDTQSLYSDMVKFIRLSDMEGGLSTAALGTKYVLILRRVQEAAYEKEMFDKIYKLTEDNKALHEPAITRSGGIVGMDEAGNIKVYDVTNTDEAARILTNADLLNMRAHDPIYAGNYQLTDIASNGIGLETVNKLIHDYINNLGSTLVTRIGQYKDPYQLAILEGLNSLQDPSKALEVLQNLAARYSGATELGTYERTFSLKQSVDQAEMAIDYIYNMLPENAKTLLNYKAKSKEGAKMIVGQFVGSGLSYNTTDNWRMLLDKSGNKPGSSGSSSETSDLKTNQVLNILNGQGGDYSRYVINGRNNSRLSIEGINYRSIIDAGNGETIESTKLSTMLAKSGILGITNTQSIYFGDLRIKSDDLSKVVYRNNGGTRVLLPMITTNGDDLAPNFEILERYQKEVADKVNAEAKPDTTFEERQALTAKYLKSSGLTELLDETGMPDMNLFGYFLVVDGYINNADIQLDELSVWIDKVSDDDTSAYDLYDEVFKEKDDKDSKTIDRPNWYEFIDSWHDTLYKASVYIPIKTNNKLQAITAAGKDVKYSTGLELLDSYNNYDVNLIQKISKMNSNSSDLLWE